MKELQINFLFQCPTSGFLLFYMRIRLRKKKRLSLFQCPTSGFLLFYSVSFIVKEIGEIWFQCPTSGFLLFYSAVADNKVRERNVSMPYLGLSSFLHEDKTEEEKAIEFVSMPYLGLSSFLLS